MRILIFTACLIAFASCDSTNTSDGANSNTDSNLETDSLESVVDTATENQVEESEWEYLNLYSLKETNIFIFDAHTGDGKVGESDLKIVLYYDAWNDEFSGRHWNRNYQTGITYLVGGKTPEGQIRLNEFKNDTMVGIIQIDTISHSAPWIDGSCLWSDNSNPSYFTMMPSEPLEGYWNGKYSRTEEGRFGDLTILEATDSTFDFILQYREQNHIGQLSGEAQKFGDEAIFFSGSCQLSFVWYEGGEIYIDQLGENIDCSAGHNASAEGTYFLSAD